MFSRVARAGRVISRRGFCGQPQDKVEKAGRSLGKATGLVGGMVMLIGGVQVPALCARPHPRPYPDAGVQFAKNGNFFGPGKLDSPVEGKQSPNQR
jgi:hypothetical protein